MLSFPSGQLGPYRLIRQIGSGGMGEVYLAEVTRLGVARQIAIKTVRIEADQAQGRDAERLFKREMQAVARLDHPYILPLYDFGEDRLENSLVTYLYMAMPFRPEGSLADWLYRRNLEKPLNLEETAHFVSQAAQALQYAHSQGFVHQDVKAANFLVRERSDQPLPDIQLSDFGIVKIPTATTISQDVRGTASSMAPEQWNGQPVPATDQYALAIMAYWLLTRQYPFKGSREQVMRQHFEAQPQPPGSFNPSIPRELDGVICTALQKSPEKRFASIAAFATAFARAIRPALAPSPVSQNVPGEATLKPPMPAEKEKTLLAPTIPVPAPNALQNEIRVQPPPSPTESTVNVPITPSIPGLASLRRQGARLFLILGLLALLILTSVGGVALGLRQGQINAQGTVTANISTRQAETNRETATANVRVTATAQANACPAYIQQCSSFPTLELSDPLQNYRNWAPGSNKQIHGTCQYKDNTYYQVSDSIAHFDMWCEGSQNFTNFIFEVHMRIVQGDCGGVTIQENSNTGQGYEFDVCSSGAYTLYKFTSFSSSNQLTGGPGQAINSSRVNTVAIAFDNGSMTMYVNQHELGSYGDDSFPSGHIALLATANQNPTTVAYTDARVWV